ncbi:nucleoside phosphorylase domain-containing protein [Aspergillus cavernicola]|uniref:Nucleoside phosphorylase domain-containing protein n=1 Tax=Aspergillus cavernicola TaxID=176166 RepID=A0ABR4IKY6_9EURO
MRPKSRSEFKIAIVCALPREADAVEGFFDEFYDEDPGQGHYGKQPGDTNAYTTGRIGEHSIVLVHMSGMGNRVSAGVARGLQISFTGVKLVLVVGICGAVPVSPQGHPIFLGDVIISNTVIEYDYGRQYPGGFQRKSDMKETTLGPPNPELKAFLSQLQTDRRHEQAQRKAVENVQELQKRRGSRWAYPGTENDVVFEASYRHMHHRPESPGRMCLQCEEHVDAFCEQAQNMSCKELGCGGSSIERARVAEESPAPCIYIGPVASANVVMKSGEHRDALARAEGAVGFEMEGAGVWGNSLCVIIKGVCDYADSHKNKTWQDYAAATAASCAKVFLDYWEPVTLMNNHATIEMRAGGSLNLDFLESIKSLTEQLVEGGNFDEAAEMLLYFNQVGWTLQCHGLFQASEMAHRCALEGRQKVYGPQQPETLVSVKDLGAALYRQGKYGDAEIYHRRALQGRTRVLGPEHRDTLVSMTDLGMALHEQGKNEEAEGLFRRAIEGKKKAFGVRDGQIQGDIDILKSILGDQGKPTDIDI